MSKIKIGLDIDGVLLNTMAEFLNLLNWKKGTNYERDDIKHYELTTCFPITKEDEALYFSNLSVRHIPLQDTRWVEVINNLIHHLKAEIILITCNSDERVKEYRRLLMLHRIPFHDIINIPYGQLKTNVLKNLNLNYYIDDSPYQIEAVKDIQKTYCYAQPWNHSVNGVYRAYNPLQFYSSVKDLETYGRDYTIG